MRVELIDVAEYDDNAVMATVDKTENGETIRIAYYMPKDSMEWRAAEYGIDPADTDTLVDMILHEPYVTVPPGRRFGEVDTDEARQALLGEIEAKKAEDPVPKGQMALFRAPGIPADPKGKFLGLMHLDPEVVEIKREIVARHLQQEQERAAARNAAARAFRAQQKSNRADIFKQQLEVMRSAAEPYVATGLGQDRPEPDNRGLR